MTEHPAKDLVRRLIADVMNGGRLDALDELCTPGMAKASRRWIAPFLERYEEVHMEVIQLVAEEGAVAGRFRCSGRTADGRAFRDVDEVYFFEVQDGRLAGAWGLEDDEARKQQLAAA